MFSSISTTHSNPKATLETHRYAPPNFCYWECRIQIQSQSTWAPGRENNGAQSCGNESRACPPPWTQPWTKDTEEKKIPLKRDYILRNRGNRVQLWTWTTIFSPTGNEKNTSATKESKIHPVRTAKRRIMSFYTKWLKARVHFGNARQLKEKLTWPRPTGASRSPGKNGSAQNARHRVQHLSWHLVQLRVITGRWKMEKEIKTGHYSLKRPISFKSLKGFFFIIRNMEKLSAKTQRCQNIFFLIKIKPQIFQIFKLWK